MFSGVQVDEGCARPSPRGRRSWLRTGSLALHGAVDGRSSDLITLRFRSLRSALLLVVIGFNVLSLDVRSRRSLTIAIAFRFAANAGGTPAKPEYRSYRRAQQHAELRPSQ